MPTTEKRDAAGAGASRGGVDFNSALLVLLMTWLLGWVLWSALPVLAGARPWLMELTSSGYKLAAFHAAREQMSLSHRFISAAEWRTLHATPMGMIEVPWQEAVGVTHEVATGEIRLNLQARPWKHAQGERAVALASWSEDGFPGMRRAYAVALPDGQRWPALCVRAALPVSKAKQQEFLSGARVRFVFSPRASMESRLESMPASAGYATAQAFMLGVTLTRVSILRPDGTEYATATNSPHEQPDC